MSTSYSAYEDETLLQLLKKGDVKAFEILYDRYVEALYMFVDSRIQHKENSKEIVQDLFEWIWTNREGIVVKSSVQNYFFGAAKHQILNYIRSKKIQDKYVNHFTHYMSRSYDYATDEMVNLSDLEKAIERSISQLPEKCQTIFWLSRMEHEPIQRIAERMNISTRTVENNISLALKHMRASLGEMVMILILSGLSSSLSTF